MCFGFIEKGYCRYCGSHCLYFRVEKQHPNLSFCAYDVIHKFKKGRKWIVSRTTPTGGNVKAPSWCKKSK